MSIIITLNIVLPIKETWTTKISHAHLSHSIQAEQPQQKRPQKLEKETKKTGNLYKLNKKIVINKVLTLCCIQLIELW